MQQEDDLCTKLKVQTVEDCSVFCVVIYVLDNSLFLEGGFFLSKTMSGNRSFWWSFLETQVHSYSKHSRNTSELFFIHLFFAAVSCLIVFSSKLSYVLSQKKRKEILA